MRNREMMSAADPEFVSGSDFLLKAERNRYIKGLLSCAGARLLFLFLTAFVVRARGIFVGARAG